MLQPFGSPERGAADVEFGSSFFRRISILIGRASSVDSGGRPNFSEGNSTHRAWIVTLALFAVLLSTPSFRIGSLGRQRRRDCRDCGPARRGGDGPGPWSPAFRSRQRSARIRSHDQCENGNQCGRSCCNRSTAGIPAPHAFSKNSKWAFTKSGLFVHNAV